MNCRHPGHDQDHTALGRVQMIVDSGLLRSKRARMTEKNMKDKTGKTLSSKEVSYKVLNRAENILLEFEIMILHLVGYFPVHHVRRFFYRLAGVTIGRASSIHMGTKFYDPRNITIGQDSIIGEGTVLDGRAKLVIGDHVDIASEVMIYNSQHNVHAEHFADESAVVVAPVTIEDYVFVGPRAIILPGVTLKKGSVVGAGAVVTRNTEENEIVGGVPAKVIGTRTIKDLNYKLGRARWFR